jgi:hypothetical protein
MNHRDLPHSAAGVRKALRYLSLLLLPTLVPKNVSGVSRLRSTSGAPANLQDMEPRLLPYLPALGSPPLRFQIPPPPPDLTTRPAAAAPPSPAVMHREEPPAPAGPKPALTTAAQAAPAETPANPDQPASTPAKAPPPSIIPDDARPAIRPEDFLPYFQIPGSAKLPGDVNLLVPALRGAPAPAPLAPSSATYTQSK